MYVMRWWNQMNSDQEQESQLQSIMKSKPSSLEELENKYLNEYKVDKNAVRDLLDKIMELNKKIEYREYDPY